MDLVRLGALGALLAGLAWAASFVVDLLVTGGGAPVLGLPRSSLVRITFGVALAATLLGLLGLHARQSGRYGFFGTLGFLAAFVGTALVFVSFVFPNLLAGQDLLDLLFQSGLVGMLLGFVLLGIATLRAGSLPSWCGVALILVLPVAGALGYYGGGLLLGVFWLALGYVLLSEGPDLLNV